MSLITATQAAELSAPVKYVKGVREGSGIVFWHVWVSGKEDTGPHALIERNTDDVTYRSCRMSRSSVGFYNGPWLGAFKTRKLAAHAALVQ